MIKQRVRGKTLSIFCYGEPEKHLWSQDAVDTLLDGAVFEGVLYFRTPCKRLRDYVLNLIW